MGRHSKQRSRFFGSRVAVSAAAVGLGALQLGGMATAAPAAAPTAAPTPAAAPSATPTATPAARTVGSTSCTDARIKACVDLSENRTWLLDGKGTVVYGPVANAHGSKGHETPTGDFVVQRKDRYHVSKEYDGASMPYSVFFDGNGRAFHQGSLDRQSAGCVRLGREDAKEFFEYLEPNDRVQIVR